MNFFFPSLLAHIVLNGMRDGWKEREGEREREREKERERRSEREMDRYR